MSDFCFLSVMPTKPGEVSIKEFAVLWADGKTLEPFTDAHFVVDDPEAVRAEGDKAAGGSLDEALARALPLIEGGVLAGFAVGRDFMLLRGAYMRQGMTAPCVADAMEVHELAWSLKLRGKVEHLNFSSVALALGISVPCDARSRVFATHAVVKRLVRDATLGARLGALNADENSIAEKVIARLEQGRREYGPWDVNDGRDYKGEALEEVIDALHYCGAQLLRMDGLDARPRNARRD